MAAAVADVVAGLEPDDGPVAVVGHSMGGKVAMALALLQPDLVSRLVVVDIAPVAYERLSSFADYVAGMRSLDLAALPDRATADRALEPYVPDPTVRGFLLQNLRRSTDGTSGWRWQMNLDLLGSHLAELGDWPQLEAAPYPGPVLWLAGVGVQLRHAGVRTDHARAVPTGAAGHGQEHRPLGSCRAAGDLRRGGRAVPASVSEMGMEV